ncbi:MAG: glycosyltransferase family 1 protein [Burkholderiales bacterium]|nr:glycosyltransferase family 1 protein [Burkholderiales bacterium]
MRIAYVTETWPPELNGVSLTVERTVRYLRARGHLVELIRPRQPGESPLDATDELRTAGCVIPMYPDLRFGLARPGTLARRFRQSRPDLVHLATPGPLPWAALAAARSLGLVTSSDFRTNFHQYSKHYGLGVISGSVLGLLRRFHNLTQRTFVPTQASRRELAEAGFHELCVVGRGVDSARFTPAMRNEALRASWQAGPQTPVLLAVGRIAAEKNVELALRAFERARRDRPDVRMVVVGDGPARGRLAAAHPAALFVGARRGDELAAYYASADAFLFPSLSDTFGNVVMEALASGLPVVAFDCAAAAEHVADGASGRLVVPGDEAGFIAATASLAVDPCSLQAMRDAAVAAARRATWDEVLARFEARLQDTVDAHQASPAAFPVVA